MVLVHFSSMANNNGSRSLPTNTSGCIIFDSWVFSSFIFTNELFAKVFQKNKTCLSVSNKLCGKLFFLLPIMFDNSVTSTEFLFQISINWADNLITSHSNFDIESFILMLN